MTRSRKLATRLRDLPVVGWFGRRNRQRHEIEPPRNQPWVRRSHSDSQRRRFRR